MNLNVTVSQNSVPFYIVVKAPSGESAKEYISSSTTVTFTDEFEELNPKGTWNVYIYNTGTTFYDASTATARMTVNYQY